MKQLSLFEEKKKGMKIKENVVDLEQYYMLFS